MLPKAESTFLVSIEQAGFDILYAFMLADGQSDEKEFAVIKDYLSKDFIHKSALFNHENSLYAECNFTKEFAYLKTLDKNSLKRRFLRAIESLDEWLANDPKGTTFKKELLDFALKVIQADNQVTSEEAEWIDLVKTAWKLS